MTYERIHSLIQNGNYIEAETALNLGTNKDDTWHFLYGLVLVQKSWFESAKKHLETAISLNPTKSNYKEALAHLMHRYDRYSDPYYRTPRYRRRHMDCCCCCDDCCCEFNCCDLICLDTCCECMGGDLIDCI